MVPRAESWGSGASCGKEESCGDSEVGRGGCGSNPSGFAVEVEVSAFRQNGFLENVGLLGQTRGPCRNGPHCRNMAEIPCKGLLPQCCSNAFGHCTIATAQLAPPRHAVPMAELRVEE